MFTINNPTIKPEELLKRYTDYKTVTAVIFQHEKGVEGTDHYQGYIEFSKSITFSRTKRMVGFNAHIEKRKGTAKEAIDYCSKEDTRVSGPFKHGEFSLVSEQGNRTDLQAVVDTIQEAKNIRDVVISHPRESIKYSRGIQFTYRHIKAPIQHKKPDVWLFYGPTGTGKTRFAMHFEGTFKKSGDSEWFDGYDNHDILLMDDFAGGRSKMSLSALLNYLDRYPVKLPIKGDFVDRNCSRIIVTTNIHPRFWYKYEDREAHYNALARRFTRVLYFNDKGAFQLDKAYFFADVDSARYPTTLVSKVPFPWEKTTTDQSMSTDSRKLSNKKRTISTSTKPPLKRQKISILTDTTSTPPTQPIPSPVRSLSSSPRDNVISISDDTISSVSDSTPILSEESYTLDTESSDDNYYDGQDI